jgi:hypothetical protein
MAARSIRLVFADDVFNRHFPYGFLPATRVGCFSRFSACSPDLQVIFPVLSWFFFGEGTTRPGLWWKHYFGMAPHPAPKVHDVIGEGAIESRWLGL